MLNNFTSSFQDDLSVLMEGIREYLPEQNVMPLEKAISQVQDAHSSCANFADILVGALNKFRVKNPHFHTVRNLHFLSKNSTLISRENCRFFG